MRWFPPFQTKGRIIECALAGLLTTANSLGRSSNPHLSLPASQSVKEDSVIHENAHTPLQVVKKCRRVVPHRWIACDARRNVRSASDVDPLERVSLTEVSSARFPQGAQATERTWLTVITIDSTVIPTETHKPFV